MRYVFAAALLLAACGGDDNEAGSSKGSSTTSTGGGGSGVGGAGGGSTVVPKCDTPDDAPYVDALDYVGRGEGPTFVEMLDVVQAHPIIYACTSVQGLSVWDASGDGAPGLLINRVDPLGGQFPHCQNVAYDPTTNRIAFSNRGDELQPQPWVWVGDFTDPGAPVPLAGYQTGSESIDGVEIIGDRVWAAAHSAGIMVFDMTGSGAGGLTLTASYSDANSDGWQPLWHKDHLLVAEGATGVRIYDVSADMPALVATVPIEGSSKDIVVHDDIAYVAASERIASIDVSDPTNPILLGETETTGTAVALAVGLNKTLLVAEWEKLRGYDINDPANMVPELSETMPPGAPNDPYSRILAVDAAPDFNRVYPAEWHGLHVYDQTPCGVGPDLEASPDSVQFGDGPERRSRCARAHLAQQRQSTAADQRHHHQRSVADAERNGCHHRPWAKALRSR